MPVLSNDQRRFTIGQRTYVIPSSLSFHERECAHFCQHRADELERHVLTMTAFLDGFCPGHYWAIGGTLLGAIRWQTILPWDDDVDFAVTATGYQQIVGAMAHIHEQWGYELVESMMGLKVYLGEQCIGDIFVCDYKKPGRLVYSGPLVDGVSYFYTHRYVFHQIAFRHTDVFPLVRRPFGAHSLPCPRRYRRILHNNYNASVFTTIRQPSGVISHSTLPKSFYQTSFRVFRPHKNRNFVRLLFCMVGMTIHRNMMGVYNGKPFMKGSLRYEELFEELRRPDVQIALLTMAGSILFGVDPRWDVVDSLATHWRLIGDSLATQWRGTTSASRCEAPLTI